MDNMIIVATHRPPEPLPAENIGLYMEGKTVAGAYFANGGGVLPTAAGKGWKYSDPNQLPDKLVIRLRDGAGIVSELQIAVNEILCNTSDDFKPFLEAYYEDRPEYFDRQ